MKRFILTGPPGAGKTSILRHLERAAYSVIDEAATDLIAAWQAQGIAQPWMQTGFIDAVADLQTHRLASAALEPPASSFTTAPSSAPLRWRTTSAICAPSRSPANWTASSHKISSTSASSSFAISASSPQPKRAASPSKNPFASKRSMKASIAVSDSTSSSSLPEPSPTAPKPSSIELADGENHAYGAGSLCAIRSARISHS